MIKSSSDSQIEQFLADPFMVSAPHHSSSPYIEAIEQADEAVQMVLAERNMDLRPRQRRSPRTTSVGAKASLVSQSFGTEPHRFVRIFRD